VVDPSLRAQWFQEVVTLDVSYAYIHLIKWILAIHSFGNNLLAVLEHGLELVLNNDVLHLFRFSWKWRRRSPLS
jgi:hypothetical protein